MDRVLDCEKHRGFIMVLRDGTHDYIEVSRVKEFATALRRDLREHMEHDIDDENDACEITFISLLSGLASRYDGVAVYTIDNEGNVNTLGKERIIERWEELTKKHPTATMFSLLASLVASELSRGGKPDELMDKVKGVLSSEAIQS